MNTFSRREALKTIGVGTAMLSLPGFAKNVDKNKKHIITLSFDDGFKKSSKWTPSKYFPLARLCHACGDSPKQNKLH